MSKWKKKLYNPVYIKETKLRVRNIKFALTILFYNLILIGIAVFGFEVLFNSGMNDYVNYGTAIGLYVALVVLESVMVGFLVPSFTAGSIAGEREKQTLEILLTTTMKPSDGIHQYGVVIGGFQFAGDFHCIHHWWSCLS